MLGGLILSPDFPAWTWEKSNGSATDEQTTSSYSVLVDVGQCSDFSRHVWNDIVDTLSNALAAVNVEWDAKYCTAEECKINVPLGALMAYAWNSVAWNMQRFGFIRWKWAWAYYLPGYVGRDTFNGYSTHGESADNLFAWYLLELTEKLNKVIQVLKNAADFSELGKTDQAVTIVRTKMAAPKIEEVKSIETSESAPYTRLNPLPTLLPEIAATGYSYENGILRPTNPFYLYTPAKAETIPYTRLELDRIAILEFERMAQSIVNSTVTSKEEVARLIDAVSIISSAFAPVISARSVPVKSTQRSKSYNRSEAIERPAAPVSHSSRHDTRHYGTVISNPAVPVRSIVRADSNDILPMIVGPAKAIRHVSESKGIIDSAAVAVRIKKLFSSVEAKGHSDSEIIASRLKYFNSLWKSESVTDSTANGLESKPMAAESKADALYIAAVAAQKIISFESYVKAGSIAACKLGLEPAETWYDPVQTGSNLYIRNAWISWSEDNKGYIDVAVWYDPKRSGNDLYIRSAWQAYADGNKEFIDMEVHYEPVRTGNDLYIKSAKLAYSDGNEGFVDMPVYYEPKQTGSNLYLRSAESMKGVIDDG